MMEFYEPILALCNDRTKTAKKNPTIDEPQSYLNNNLLEHGNKPTNEDVLPKYYAQRTILKSPKAKLIKSYGEYAIYSYAP